MTPKVLRKFFKFLNTDANKQGETSTLAHVGDLVLGAFFLAMRSCKHTKSVPIGRTKRARMGCFVFRTASRRMLLHNNPKLLHHAQHVTIVFEDQKNGTKMDARTIPVLVTSSFARCYDGDPQCKESSRQFQTGMSRRHSAPC
jgi:hypothetical protein